MNNPSWTSWFEEQMQALATANNLVCQNLSRQGKRGEWLKVDHVFVQADTYDAFPRIVVEHENRDLGSKDGSLPTPSTGEFIEWANWKVLTINADLAVLVAYPLINQQKAALDVLSKIATAAREHRRGSGPEFLALLGWWHRGKPLTSYQPYVLDAQKSYLVSLAT